MFNESDYLRLVSRAQLGDSESVNLLSKEVRGELCTYIYRITLDFDLTEDIAQETLLEMVQAIKDLKDSRRFKSWLFCIASTKIKKHYRLCGNKRIMDKTAFDAEKLSQHVEQKPDALGRLLKEELSQAIYKAMAKLKYNYRNVLILRCFEQMSYPDIAYTMRCSSMEAQLLFFRAKHSLKKQLQSRGYKKEHLLASLGIFAGITAMPFKTASASTAAVTPAAMKVGALAAVIGAATTKIGVTAAVIAATTLLTVSVPIALNNHNIGKFHIISEGQLDQSKLKYPSAIAASFNPQGNYWLGTLDGNNFSKADRLEQWLVGPPPSHWSAILIPKNGWISLRFSSPIVDKPGDDIIVVEKCPFGEKANVFLADDDNNKTFIGTINVPDRGQHMLTIFGCDIAGLDLPFTPTNILILTTNPGETEHNAPLPGFDLVSVRAHLSD